MGNELFGDVELSISAVPLFILIGLLLIIALLIQILFSRLPKSIFNFLISCGLLGGVILWGYLTFYTDWFPRG
jgi:hypothetical protein